jgi:hypothetical protein
MSVRDTVQQLTTQITQIVTDFLNLVKAISPMFVVMGFLGLGIMYLGAPLPFIKGWKDENPQAFRVVSMGLFFVIFSSVAVNIVGTP